MTPLPKPSRGRFWSFAALAAAGAMLVAHARTYLPFISDDALISLRYSRRLIEGKGLTWDDTDRVEGYSNLTWVLANAALGAMGVDLIDAARVLGFAGMIGAMAALAFAYVPRRTVGVVPILAGTFAMALAGPFGVWAVGGLEQPFVAAFLAWGVWGVLRGVEDRAPSHLGLRSPERRLRPDPLLWGAGLSLSLLCLTRPDGPLFVATLALAVLWNGLTRAPKQPVSEKASSEKSTKTRKFSLRPGTLRQAASLVALPVAAVIGQLLFRIVYYRETIPNSARAKVSFTSQRLEDGWKYWTRGMSGMRELVALAVIGLVIALIWRRKRAIVLLIPTLAWSLYVIVIGGDIFPGRRHLVALVVLMAFFVAEGFAILVEKSAPAVWGGAVVTAGLLFSFDQNRTRDGEHERPRWEKWEWDGEVLAKLLVKAFGKKQPTIATDPAGCVPYFSNLPAIDLLGINDREIAHTPRPEWFGRGYLGHELGNGRSVLRRHPDLYLFCGPQGAPGGCFRSGHEIMRNARFASEHDLVTFEGRDPHRFRSLLFVRREGGKIGIERTAGRVFVPGFLLATDGTTLATLDAQDRFGALVAPGQTAELVVALDWRPYRLSVDAALAPPPPVEVECMNEVLASGTPPLELEIPPGCEDVWVRVTAPSGGYTHVRRLTFTEIKAVSKPAPEPAPVEEVTPQTQP